MKVKTYTQAEMLREAEKIMRKAETQIRIEAIDLMLHLATWAVWDCVPKISKKRIKRVLEFMSEQAAFIVDGTITVEDIKKTLKDEAGIEIGFVDEMRKQGERHD